jgi:hypothetical protein
MRALRIVCNDCRCVLWRLGAPSAAAYNDSGMNERYLALDFSRSRSVITWVVPSK